MYTTTVQDVIARIVVFKIFGCKIAMLMILVCRSYYPAVSLLINYLDPVDKCSACTKTLDRDK